MDTPSFGYVASGLLFTALAVAGAWWQWRREMRQRRTVFQRRFGGDVTEILRAAGPDEREVLRTIRREQGEHAAAIRLRRVDRDLPFESLVAAVRTL